MIFHIQSPRDLCEECGLEMEYVTAVRGISYTDGEYAFRIVFKCKSGKHYAYQGFANDDHLWKVQCWRRQTLEEAMSLWSTKEQYEPSEQEIEKAKRRIVELLFQPASYCEVCTQLRVQEKNHIDHVWRDPPHGI